MSRDIPTDDTVPTLDVAALLTALDALRAEVARLTERVRWFEAAGGVAMSIRIHHLFDQRAADTALLREARETILALVDQQAMPDDSWRPVLARLAARLKEDA